MNKIVIGITGHRILSEEQKEKIKPVLEKAFKNIMFSCSERDNPISFVALSPLAEGADTLFANTAVSLGLQLHVMLPYEREEYLKSFSSDEVRKEFDRIYDSVGNEHKSQLNSIKDKELNDLFLELGEQLADDIDFLIAIWNEKKAKGKGGTGDIVAYAVKKKKRVLIINPEDTHPLINYLNPDYYDEKSVKELIDPHETNHLAAYISRKQKEYDRNAVSSNVKYRRIWTIGFVTGLTELLAFSMTISLHLSMQVVFLLTSVEYMGILTIICLVIFGRSKKLHSDYVHYRIISERLRIKRFFSELGFYIYPTAVSPIYFSLKEKPEFSILDNTIRLINLSAYSYIPFEKKKQRLQSELIAKQHTYHKRKKEKYEKRNNIYKKVRKFLFFLFVIAVSIHYFEVADEYFTESKIHQSSFLPHLFHAELFEDIVLFLSLFIPAAIAASEALKYLYEWEKIITLSAAMSEYFKQESKKLKNTATDQELEMFLNAISRDMLIENLDWEKYMHDKNEVPT
jgi:hypothetical protein